MFKIDQKEYKLKMSHVFRIVQTKSEGRRLAWSDLFHETGISSIRYFTGYNSEVGDLELEEAWKDKDNVNKLCQFFSRIEKSSKIDSLPLLRLCKAILDGFDYAIIFSKGNEDLLKGVRYFLGLERAKKDTDFVGVVGNFLEKTGLGRLQTKNKITVAVIKPPIYGNVFGYASSIREARDFAKEATALHIKPVWRNGMVEMQKRDRIEKLGKYGLGTSAIFRLIATILSEVSFKLEKKLEGDSMPDEIRVYVNEDLPTPRLNISFNLICFFQNCFVQKD